MYSEICKEIMDTARKCGRDLGEITLVAVTKQVDWQAALSLYQLGQRDFGESRIPEALMKKNSLPNDCRWHFIGKLQSNKVRKAVGAFSLIHSIDSYSLAETVSQVSRELGCTTSILLQANTSGEASKQGLSPKEWQKCFQEVLTLPGIAVQGLMTMAPLDADEEEIRASFRKLRQLRDEMNGTYAAGLRHLSMGMSRDFKIAIEEGATLLRIGSALYNQNPTPWTTRCSQ